MTQPSSSHPFAPDPSPEPVSVRLQSEPQVVERPAQPYVAVRAQVTMATIDAIADRIPDVLTFAADRGLQEAGPAFLRYLTIDMERELEIEAGVPITRPAEGDGAVHAGVLPAGRYVTTSHVGHPDELMGVTGALLAWAAERGLRWDVEDSPAGERWGCRLELYPTDPRVEPDMNRWTTELAFRLADDVG